MPEKVASAGSARGLDGSAVLLGITGSISAAAMPAVLLQLRQQGVRAIDIIVTRSGARFVQLDALAQYSGGNVHVDADGQVLVPGVPHIELTRRADILVVMPASANIIGKAAHGIADTLLSTALVAATCPILFVPSMNSAMWTNGFVQRNVAALRAAGHTVLDPGSGVEVGSLAITIGGMATPGQVFHEMNKIIAASALPKRQGPSG